MTIAEAKARLTIHELWRRLDLPDEPKASCKSPFREDRNASFSVSQDGFLWNDFAAGTGGDAVDFLQQATGLSKEDACRKFLEMAGGSVSPPLPAIKRGNATAQARPKPNLGSCVPDLRRGTDEEFEQLAELRRVRLAAVILADRAGLLRFGTWRNKRSWLVLDDERFNAQARRMDGQLWPVGKAQTLPGCWAGWPIGIAAGRTYPTLLLVEGGPDLLAALHFINQLGAEATHFPVAMLGAAQRIHDDALPYFAGKTVRIMAHADEAGGAGAQRWAAQIKNAGGQVDIGHFCKDDGSPIHKVDGAVVKDLNDCTQINPDDAGELEGLLP